MDKIFNGISVIFGVAGGVVVNLLGAWDKLLYVLIAFMVLDYLSGVIKGIYQNRLSSEIGFKGLLKKVVVLVVVAVANLVQTLIGDTFAIREIVIMFFVANEGISILENAAVLYPKIPQQLKDVLLQLREDKEDK